MNAAVIDEIDSTDSEGVPWSQDVEAIHRWYRIIMGFDWQLADHIIDRLDIGPRHVVLDPFCGAGTTLVQCKKRGIEAVGIDVNPVCVLATNAKTTWTLDCTLLQNILEGIVRAAQELRSSAALASNSALEYLRRSGMIDRGWLSLHKARKVLAIREAIREFPMATEYRDFFHLALVSAIVSKIADIKFGPEVYCLRSPKRLPVTASFVDVAQSMIVDMEYAGRLKMTGVAARAVLGDARTAAGVRSVTPNGADYVITSPPYPNEHDYTRSTRLELVFLDFVGDLAGLRRIKKQMVRCTTKGIYREDIESALVAQYPAVERVASSLDERAQQYTDGFSKLYGRMIREYFGGMSNHFDALNAGLRPGAQCAYVVRDSQSLLGVYVDTPSLLAEIAAKGHGFVVEDVVEWKKVKGTTGKRILSEKIILLRKSK